MKEALKIFWKHENNCIKLASINRSEVDKYNKQALSTLLLLGWILVLVPLVAVPFSNTKAAAVPAYLLSFSSFFVLFLLFKTPIVKKHTLIGLYAGFSVLFLLGIYLSVIHSPYMRATILLGGFVILPLSFIDSPRRSVLVLAFWFIIHAVLAYNYKPPQYALDDTINCLVAAVLGIYLGQMMVKVRLESFEAQRLLTIEKETDVLTGLYNRRKLFEKLALLETKDAEKPSGILMIDIDYFKEFNDNYGHAAGDKCLRYFGETLNRFAQHFKLEFYRYGGEEFVAIAYRYNEKELFSIAESLRIAVQSTDIEGGHITVSIGVAYCDEEQILNYEKVIDRADQAVYFAKREGRNKVCMEQNGK